jgi:hypothetical protein
MDSSEYPFFTTSNAAMSRTLIQLTFIFHNDGNIADASNVGNNEIISACLNEYLDEDVKNPVGASGTPA